MKFGRKVTVYLADGNPLGIRHVEIANWSGQAIACPRSRLGELKDWPEAQRPGVYFLLEKQSAETGDRAYIGESENVAKRIVQQTSRDFWNEAVIFTSKDENLTKGHIKYLESKLTSISIAADRYVVENGNSPTESLLPRADRDAMEEFIENLEIVLGTLGHKVLVPVNSTEVDETLVEHSSSISSIQFGFQVRDLVAKGQQGDDGFIVLKGSQIAGNISTSLPGKVQLIREKWINEGRMIPDGDNFVLSKDGILSSSSYAAALVAGTSRSGPQSWLAPDGRSLKTVEESLVEGNS